MNLRLIAIVVLVALLVSACAGGDAEGPGDEGAPIKIGAVLALSGAAADLGIHERDGIEIAIREINEAGGVNGRPMRVVFRDSAGDPNQAVSVFNELASDDEIIAVFGDTFGSGSLAISPISKRLGIPHLAPNTTFEVTHVGNEYLFRVAPPANVEVDAAIDVLESGSFSRLGLFCVNDAYGTQACDLFEDSGLPIVVTDSFGADDTDLTSQMANARGEDVDGLIIWDHSPAVGLAIANAGDLGMTDVPIFSGQAANVPGNIEAAGDSPALENWIVQGVVDPEQPLPRQEDQVALFKEEVDYAPDIFISIGYDGMHILAEALEAAGENADRESVRDALENSVKNLELVGGIYTYGPDNHDGVGPESIVWLRVEGDTFVAEDPESFLARF